MNRATPAWMRTAMLGVLLASAAAIHRAAHFAAAVTEAQARATSQSPVQIAGANLAQLNRRFLANEALTPEFVEAHVVGSRRLRDARIAAASSDRNRLEAANAHVRHCEMFSAIMQKRCEPSVRITTLLTGATVEALTVDLEFTDKVANSLQCRFFDRGRVDE